MARADDEARNVGGSTLIDMDSVPNRENYVLDMHIGPMASKDLAANIADRDLVGFVDTTLAGIEAADLVGRRV